MASTVTCHCTARWTGVGPCHCPTCHVTWATPELFDQHRWHVRGQDGCWPPQELTDHGRPLVCQDGVWGVLEVEKRRRVGRRVRA
jgi:hypothetical protein